MISLVELGAVPDDASPEARKANLNAFARTQKEHLDERIILPAPTLYLAAPLVFDAPSMLPGDKASASKFVFAPGCGIVVGENVTAPAIAIGVEGCGPSVEEPRCTEVVSIYSQVPRGDAAR